MTTTKPLTSTKSPIHIFTDSTSALSLSNKAWAQQEIEAHPFALPLRAGHPGYWTCQHPKGYLPQTSLHHSLLHRQLWSDIFVTTASLNCTSKRGRSTTSTSLELVKQYFNDDENIEYTEEQQKRAQHKFRQQLRQLFKKKKKKENKKQNLEKKCREAAQAAQRADIEHKQSQLLLQHQDLSHSAQQPQVILIQVEDIEGQERRTS